MSNPQQQGPADVAPEYIRSLPPYVPGKPAGEVQREQGIESVTKLASNENPLGVSPKAVAAMGAALAGVAIYPDPNGFDLKSALCARFGVEPAQIVLGNGSSELLDLAARAFLRDGDEAIYAQYSFIAYPVAVKAVGANGVQVPALDYGHDLDAMARAITARTKLVFVANPNNPTGTWLDEAAIRGFLAKVPRQVLVILDEAYTEYLPPDKRMDAFAMVREFPNLVVLRTFSKAYGLAGVRVGFAVAQPAVADLLNRTRLVFNVNALAQVAAAAALEDDEFVTRTYDINRAGQAQLCAAFDRLGLPYVPSFGNFVLVDFSGARHSAAEINQRLLARGFIVRPLGPYGLTGHLRITIGLEHENAAFIGALEAVLTG
jgi:histidinol-phosphate aminotransferase